MNVLDGKLDSKQDAVQIDLDHVVDDNDCYGHCERPDSVPSC